MTKFYKVSPGEWQRPRHKDYTMVCCDCGLVHRMNFRVLRDTPRKGQNSVALQAFRDVKRTTAYRKRHGITVK